MASNPRSKDKKPGKSLTFAQAVLSPAPKATPVAAAPAAAAAAEEQPDNQVPILDDDAESQHFETEN